MNKILMSLSFVLIFTSAAYAKVYATVNGEDITDRDMLFLKQAMPNVDFTTLPKDMQDKAIDQAIERKLLTKEAQKEKLENTNEYKEALEDFKETMVLELWMRKQLENIKISENEIKKFYSENKDKLIVPEGASARHILVDTEKEAKDIIKELDKVSADKSEEKFIELAKSHSKDPSAQNGGDLGTFAREQMLPEFSDAAFALKDNTYTKTPVKTNYGYHVIFLKSKKPKGIVGYEEAKPRLEQELKLVKFREMVSQKAKELRKKAKVVIK